MFDIPIPPVVAASLVVACLSVVWYSTFVFGPLWARAVGRSHEYEPRFSLPRQILALAALFGVFYALASLFVLFELSNRQSLTASFIAAIIALLPVLSAVLWEDRPRSYFFVHGVFLFGALIIGGAIITYWPW